MKPMIQKGDNVSFRRTPIECRKRTIDPFSIHIKTRICGDWRIDLAVQRKPNFFGVCGRRKWDLWDIKSFILPFCGGSCLICKAKSDFNEPAGGRGTPPLQIRCVVMIFHIICDLSLCINWGLAIWPTEPVS